MFQYIHKIERVRETDVCFYYNDCSFNENSFIFRAFVLLQEVNVTEEGRVEFKSLDCLSEKSTNLQPKVDYKAFTQVISNPF